MWPPFQPPSPPAFQQVNLLFLSVLRIRDFYLGSRIQIFFSIPDPAPNFVQRGLGVGKAPDPQDWFYLIARFKRHLIMYRGILFLLGAVIDR
jgi:hypothetical protein